MYVCDRVSVYACVCLCMRVYFVHIMFYYMYLPDVRAMCYG